MNHTKMGVGPVQEEDRDQGGVNDRVHGVQNTVPHYPHGKVGIVGSALVALDGWMDGWRDGGMEGWRDGGMEGWSEGGREGGREGREGGREGGSSSIYIYMYI